MTRPRQSTARHPHSAALLGAAAVLAAVLLVGCGAKHADVVGVAPTTASTPTTTPAAEIPSGSSPHTITVGATPRTYRTFVPANLDRSKPVPLVVMLHGGFGTASQAEKNYGWDPEAQTKGFVVVYPDAVKRAWNAGTCCGAPSKDDIDDVAFITQVVATLKGQVSVDPGRVFVAGMSNGAMMSERLGCETSVFAAVASVAGAQMVPCDDPAPLSVLFIHGLADTHVSMDGSPGNGKGKVPAHPPTRDAFAAWQKVDGCQPPVATTKGPVVTSSAACGVGRAVELITIAGAGHQWPGAAPHPAGMGKRLDVDTPSKDLDATAVIWSFFAAHPRSA